MVDGLQGPGGKEASPYQSTDPCAGLNKKYLFVARMISKFKYTGVPLPDLTFILTPICPKHETL